MEKFPSIDPPITLGGPMQAQGAGASTAAAATLAVLFALGAATTWDAPQYLGQGGIPLYVAYVTMAVLMGACAVLMHQYKSRLMASVILVAAALIALYALASGNLRLAVFVAFALPCAGLGLRGVWPKHQPEVPPLA